MTTKGVGCAYYMCTWCSSRTSMSHLVEHQSVNRARHKWRRRIRRTYCCSLHIVERVGRFGADVAGLILSYVDLQDACLLWHVVVEKLGPYLGSLVCDLALCNCEFPPAGTCCPSGLLTYVLSTEHIYVPMIGKRVKCAWKPARFKYRKKKLCSACKNACPKFYS